MGKISSYASVTGSVSLDGRGGTGVGARTADSESATAAAAEQLTASVVDAPVHLSREMGSFGRGCGKRALRLFTPGRAVFSILNLTVRIEGNAVTPAGSYVEKFDF